MSLSLMNEEQIKREKTFWERRSVLEKRLILVGVVVIVIVLSSIIALLIAKPILKRYFGGNQNNKNITCPHSQDEVCINPGCVNAAAHLLKSIDTTVDPCDDFYRFACGNYIKNTVIPDDKIMVTTFTALVDELQLQLRSALEEDVRENESRPMKLVKQYYQACMNKDVIEKHGVQELKDILKAVNGWPVLEGEKWNEKNFDWKELTYKFNKIGFPIMPFVEFSVGVDLKNSSVRSIQIDQPAFGISREFLLKGVDMKIVKAYYRYMVDVAVALGCNRTTAEKELKQSLEFEIEMAKLAMPKEERRNISKIYNVMSIGEFQQNYSSVFWIKFINQFLPTEIQVDHNETMILISPQYVKSLIPLLDKTPKRVQANYAVWRAIKQQIPYLTENLHQKLFDFRHVVIGIMHQEPRWKECVDEVSSSLPILTSALYVRKYFHEDAKKAAVEMVRYIKESFTGILRSLDWMDDKTRGSALDKASAVVDHIGYPDELLNDTKLEALYKSLEVNADRYLQSHLKIDSDRFNFNTKRLREPVNKTDWIEHGHVAQVNAFYHPLENSIMLPAGILQGTFFSKDRPNFMNYAAIGSVIGHELTHGFDDTGRQFDKDGDFVDWWAPDTKQAFFEKAQCIIDQYGSYAVPEINETLNGVNTQGENIADNGGIKEAYLAYEMWVKKNGPELKLPGLAYTPNQIFWISGAMNWCAKYRPETLTLSIATDAHSLSEFRVLGPFSNTDYFSRDFNCTLGTRMNPKHKCSVW